MEFKDILSKCVGQTVAVNNDQERQLVSVDDDFIVLSGGNPQMKLTEFVPIQQIVRVIRADYTATNESSISIDINNSAGDQRRSAH